jgi:CdiI immunity protein
MTGSIDLDTATTKRLRQFFGGYFHQDWDIDGGDWRGVLGVYCRQNGNEALGRLSADLERLLALVVDDHAITEYLATELWCNYVPQGGPDAARQWLREVVAAVQEQLSERAK